MKQNKESRCKNFIEKANRRWNNKYDYSKVEYVNGRTDICIVCPIHGNFHITPRQHLCGHGCTKCAKNGKITTEEFVKKATFIHNELLKEITQI